MEQIRWWAGDEPKALHIEPCGAKPVCCEQPASWCVGTDRLLRSSRWSGDIMGQLCSCATAPPAAATEGPLELSVLVIGPDAASRTHLLDHMRTGNFLGGKVEVTSSSDGEFTITRFIVPNRGLSPRIDPNNAVLMHVREGLWSWSSDLSPNDASLLTVDCLCVVAPESTFVKNGSAFEYALLEHAMGMAETSHLAVFCAYGDPADERRRELQPLLQRLGAALGAKVDTRFHAVHDLASDAGGKSALFGWIGPLLDLGGRGHSGLLDRYRSGDFVPARPRTARAEAPCTYASITAAADIALHVPSPAAEPEDPPSVHTWETPLRFHTGPAAGRVEVATDGGHTTVAVWTDVACAEVGEFPGVLFAESPPPRLYVMIDRASDERELFVLAQAPPGQAPHDRQAGDTSGRRLEHGQSQWWVAGAWEEAPYGPKDGISWRSGCVGEAAEVSGVTSLIASHGEQAVALHEAAALRGEAASAADGGASEGERVRTWTITHRESASAAEPLTLSVTCDGTRTVACAHTRGQTYSSDHEVEDRSIAATGPLVSAPLLYADAGLTSFALIARGSACTAQFLGVVAPGRFTKFVVRKLEPSARKMLYGHYIAQPTWKEYRQAMYVAQPTLEEYRGAVRGHFGGGAH